MNEPRWCFLNAFDSVHNAQVRKIPGTFTQMLLRIGDRFGISSIERLYSHREGENEHTAAWY